MAEQEERLLDIFDEMPEGKGEAGKEQLMLAVQTMDFYKTAKEGRGKKEVLRHV